MKYNYPCKDCPDRYVGCHAKCEKYQTAAREAGREMKERQKREKVESELAGFMKDAKKRRRTGK